MTHGIALDHHVSCARRLVCTASRVHGVSCARRLVGTTGEPVA